MAAEVPLPSPVWEELGGELDFCREKVKRGISIIVNSVIRDEHGKPDKYPWHRASRGFSELARFNRFFLSFFSICGKYQTISLLKYFVE